MRCPHHFVFWSITAGLFGVSAEAVPLVYRFSGIADAGRAYDAGHNLVDLAGLPYELTVLTDTTVPDTAPGDTTRGLFNGSPAMQVVINVGPLGPYSVSPPDLIRLFDDGTDASVSLTWAGGIEGVIGLALPPGHLGDPNQMGPFPAIDVTDTFATAAFGGYDFAMRPRDEWGVWFEDHYTDGRTPITVSATTRLPDAGSSLILLGLGMVALFGRWAPTERRPV